MYPTVLVLCLLSLAIRTTYEVLKRSARVDPENRAVFWLVFVAMITMLASWPLLGWCDPMRSSAPAAVAGIGLVLVIVGAGLAATGLLQLRGLENIDHLVTVGVYARLRHPMYTGFVLWIAGWVLVFAAEATLVAAGIAIANILLWRQLEERQLQEQFGNAYLAYRDLTWF